MGEYLLPRARKTFLKQNTKSTIHKTKKIDKLKLGTYE